MRATCSFYQPCLWGLLLLLLTHQHVARSMPFDDEATLVASLLSGKPEAHRLIKAIAAAGAGNATDFDQETLSHSRAIAVAAGLERQLDTFIIHSLGGGNFDTFALVDEAKFAAFNARLVDAGSAASNDDAMRIAASVPVDQRAQLGLDKELSSSGGDTAPPFDSIDDMCTSCPFEVREIAGRGRGLVATRHVVAGQTVAEFGCFGYTLYSPNAQVCHEHSRAAASAQPTEVCAACLRFAMPGQALPERCSRCPDRYCSEACRLADGARGHALCCAALQRVSAIKPAKASDYVRSTTSFLLRSFARRRADADRGGREVRHEARHGLLPGGMTTGARRMAPTFEEAISQCQAAECQVDAPSPATMEAHRAAVRLAQLQSRKLVCTSPSASPQPYFHAHPSPQP